MFVGAWIIPMPFAVMMMIIGIEYMLIFYPADHPVNSWLIDFMFGFLPLIMSSVIFIWARYAYKDEKERWESFENCFRNKISMECKND